MMEPTPVYICTGFLDSGKTLLVKDTLMEQEWISYYIIKSIPLLQQREICF